MSQEIKDRIDEEVNPYPYVKPKVIGNIIKALSDETDSKVSKVDYNQHFRGSFATLAALLSNNFNPPLMAGDKAQVNTAGQEVENYTWDADDSEWIKGANGSAANNTDELPEGSSNLYFTEERAETVAEGVVTLEKKNYVKEVYVLAVMEIILPMQLAGQFTALQGSSAMSNFEYKIGVAGTYTPFTTPVNYSANAEIYIKWDYISPTEQRGWIRMIGKDN